MDRAGIDVRQKEPRVCILNPTGEVAEVRIATTRERSREGMGDRTRARVLLETSTGRERAARCREEWGHDVLVADPGLAPECGRRTGRVRTGLREARALAGTSRSSV